MKRDPRLRGLSSEHHRALVLARALRSAAEAGGRVEDLGSLLDGELEPHFQAEERLLLPGLKAAGRQDLVEQTLADHAFLRFSVGAAQRGDIQAMRAFAERLQDHVRFEERTLFPACEALLSGEQLARLRGGS